MSWRLKIGHVFAVQICPADGVVCAQFSLPCHFSSFIYLRDPHAMNNQSGSQYWQINDLMVNFDSYSAKIIFILFHGAC